MQWLFIMLTLVLELALSSWMAYNVLAQRKTSLTAQALQLVVTVVTMMMQELDVKVRERKEKNDLLTCFRSCEYMNACCNEDTTCFIWFINKK